VALLNKYPKVKIQIEEHCDERGTIEYNIALGERWPNSTKKYLISLSESLHTVSPPSAMERRSL
jgi:peptidoglycan-associated lipoprotein